MDVLKSVTRFIWDQHNREKNWIKHRVHFTECEEVLFNSPLYVLEGSDRSANEARWYALGQTNHGRNVFVVFTLRGQGLRVICARDMSRKERSMYATLNKKNS